MNTSKFWENVFSNLGFEETTILGRTAFKIPIYEAIYMSQVMGPPEPSDFNIWWRQSFRVAIPTKDGKVLRFPNPCPSVLTKNVFLDEISMDSQLNPMLSPSLNFIKRSVPEFFNSVEKYLVFGNESNLLEQIRAEGLNPTNFVLFKEGSESGTKKGLPQRYIDEPIIEYITSSFFRSKGFIVDKFNEGLTMGGQSQKMPDLFAIKIPDLQNKLTGLKVTAGGFYLNELELPRLLGERTTENRTKEAKSVVIEVESPTDSGRFSAGKRQLLGHLGGYSENGYLEFGCYDEGYVAVPFEADRVDEDVGIITLTEKGDIILRDMTGKLAALIACDKAYSLSELKNLCSRYGISPSGDKKTLCGKLYDAEVIHPGARKSYRRQEKIKELLENVERIVKLTLLKNLPLIRVFELFPQVQTFYDLYFAVDKLEVEEIVSHVKQNLGEIGQCSGSVKEDKSWN